MLKKFLVSIFILIVSIILISNKNYAVLQANGNEGATYNVNDWVINVRNMEKLGGAMGLTEEINEDLTTKGASNNIDVHQEKNSEYGAMVILSASSYGNPNKIENGDTTTGNSTGVVMKLNSEWIAVKGTDDIGITLNPAERYIDRYNYGYVQKDGDAISETGGWHGSYNEWLHGCHAYSGDWIPSLLRAYSGSVFSYYGRGARNGSFYGNGPADAYRFNGHHSRAVVVCGQGL